MESIESLRNKIRVLDIERSKHRKLLNKYAGSGNLVYLNYHHAEIVRLIKETEIIEETMNTNYFNKPLIGILSVGFNESLSKILDDKLLNGE